MVRWRLLAYCLSPLWIGCGGVSRPVENVQKEDVDAPAIGVHEVQEQVAEVAVTVEPAESSAKLSEQEDASEPEECAMADFIRELAALNRYEGEFEAGKAPEINATGLEAFGTQLHEEVELTQLKAGLKVVERTHVLDQLRAGSGDVYERLMRVGYSINVVSPDEIHVLTIDGGAMMMVGNYYHLRFLEDFCTGALVELRDVEGSLARPRFPEKGQIGFDCTRDRSVYEGEADKATIQKALAPRRAEMPSVNLSWQVFPNSPSPLVRETREGKDGCSVHYLTVSPDQDTCEGRRYKVWEIGSETCCTASACDHGASFYFHTFMDALSLRDMVAVKRFIKPGGELVIDGNIVSEPRVLKANTWGTSLAAFKKAAPGWAGGDAASCREDSPPDPDLGDTGPTKAVCHFGGGGTHFRADLERPQNSKRWYVVRLHGDAH